MRTDLFLNIIKGAVRPSVRTSAWLLRLMLPISLTVQLLQYFGVIAWLATWLNPVFSYLGLPGASAIAFMTAAGVTTYAGLAVMLSMELTMRQATMVFATQGISALWILSTRILFALALVWGKKAAVYYSHKVALFFS